MLSPLLFSLYMNDIVQCTEAAVNLFADGTSIYVTDKVVSSLQTKLQLVLDQLASWFGSWAFPEVGIDGVHHQALRASRECVLVW